jgi:peptidoglycan hydrolase CwlO-like protein
VLILLAVNLASFSQTVTCLSNDTVICFSIPQSKILLTKIAKGNESKELLTNYEGKSTLLSDLVNQHESTISILTRISDNKESIINNKNREIEIYQSEIKGLKKEIKRQKLYKWAAVLTTGLVFSISLLK